MVEPEIYIFLFASVLFQQINMAPNDCSQLKNVTVNSHSVVCETLINGICTSNEEKVGT